MSRVLAIETSSELCTVALYCDGEVRVREQLGVRDHTRQVLPFADELLAEAGLALGALDALAVGRGPGSFTGLRVAVAMVQGLAMGADLGVAAVSSLQALALQACDRGAGPHVLTLIDARMDEIYAACFDAPEGVPQISGKERLLAPEQLDLPAGLRPERCWIAGSGLVHAKRLPVTDLVPAQQCLPELRPRAQEVARLGAAVLGSGNLLSPEQVQPVYLRNRVAERPRS